MHKFSPARIWKDWKIKKIIVKNTISYKIDVIVDWIITYEIFINTILKNIYLTRQILLYFTYKSDALKEN